MKMQWDISIFSNMFNISGNSRYSEALSKLGRVLKLAPVKDADTSMAS
jgi:hypothetical protein